MQKSLLLLTLLVFGGLTGLALWEHGFVGVLKYQMQNSAGQQVFMDLSIALGLAMVWMYRDAKAHQRNPWPWIVLTLIWGSFGPLFYLITQPRKTQMPEA